MQENTNEQAKMNEMLVANMSGMMQQLEAMQGSMEKMQKQMNKMEEKQEKEQYKQLEDKNREDEKNQKMIQNLLEQISKQQNPNLEMNAQAQNFNQVPNNSLLESIFPPKFNLANFDTNQFLKGLLVGGLATYALTNENVQKLLVQFLTKGWMGLQGGFEEIKEQFLDAQAEMESSKD